MSAAEPPLIVRPAVALLAVTLVVLIESFPVAAEPSIRVTAPPLAVLVPFVPANAKSRFLSPVIFTVFNLLSVTVMLFQVLAPPEEAMLIVSTSFSTTVPAFTEAAPGAVLAAAPAKVTVNASVVPVLALFTLIVVVDPPKPVLSPDTDKPIPAATFETMDVWFTPLSPDSVKLLIVEPVINSRSKPGDATVVAERSKDSKFLNCVALAALINDAETVSLPSPASITVVALVVDAATEPPVAASTLSSPAPRVMLEPAATADANLTVSLPSPVETVALPVADSVRLSLPEPVLTVVVTALSVPNVKAPVAAEPSILVAVVIGDDRASAAEPVIFSVVAAAPDTATLLLVPVAFRVIAVAAAPAATLTATPVLPLQVWTTLLASAEMTRFLAPMQVARLLLFWADWT